MPVKFKVYTEYQHEPLLWNLKAGHCLIAVPGLAAAFLLPGFHLSHRGDTVQALRQSTIEVNVISWAVLPALCGCLDPAWSVRNRESMLQELSQAPWVPELIFSTRRSAFDEEGIYMEHFPDIFLRFFFSLKDEQLQVDLRKCWASESVQVNNRSEQMQTKWSKTKNQTQTNKQTIHIGSLKLPS